MSVATRLRQSADYGALLKVSEAVGCDPLQVQGPGGNTSVKEDGVMVIKASGTWLAEAKRSAIMVTVDVEEMRRAIAAGDPAADNTRLFVVEDPQNGDLRPSIETSVHAVLTHRFVLHTHCVETIAAAIRADGAAVVAEKLGRMGAVFVPYTKPGASLAQGMLDAGGDDAPIYVLGNHGLVAGGATADEAEARLADVAKALSGTLADGREADPSLATHLAGTGWMPAALPITHAVAHDPARLAMAAGTTLYPDHLIFLGPGVVVASVGESPAEAVRRASETAPVQRLVLLPGLGAAIPEDASPPMHAMARAIGDVLARVPSGVDLSRLSDADEADLLDWDAEKYRQALQVSRASS